MIAASPLRRRCDFPAWLAVVLATLSCRGEPPHSYAYRDGDPLPQPSTRPPERGVLSRMSPANVLLRGVQRRLPPSDVAPGVEQVFQAIDGYCWDDQWMYCLGDVKGSIVDSVVAEWVRGRAGAGPARGVEYGSFVGYSAMRIARHLPPGSEFICVEPNYKYDYLRVVVDKILSLADMAGVVKFRSDGNYEAIEAWDSEKVVFDVACTDHIKEDYLPTLQKMISVEQLRTGGLFLADNVVLFNLVDLLKYLRFSGNFVDYRLYYAAAEYDDFHGRPNAEGDYRPDGVVSAVYAGPGRGQKFVSPGASACSRFEDCSACLANLCAWCEGASAGCVPDVPGERRCPKLGTMIGLSSGDIKCQNSTLGPMSWVGPEDASGTLRWQRVPSGRLNAGFFEGYAAASSQVDVEFLNDSPPGLGLVEILRRSPEGDAVRVGSIEPQSKMSVSSYRGHTFIARCAFGLPSGGTDDGETWTLDGKAGRRQKIRVKRECSGREEL